LSEWNFTSGSQRVTTVFKSLQKACSTWRWRDALGENLASLWRCTGTSGARQIGHAEHVRTFRSCHSLHDWLRGTVVERWSVTGELYLSYARLAADGW